MRIYVAVLIVLKKRKKKCDQDWIKDRKFIRDSRACDWQHFFPIYIYGSVYWHIFNRKELRPEKFRGHAICEIATWSFSFFFTIFVRVCVCVSFRVHSNKLSIILLTMEYTGDPGQIFSKVNSDLELNCESKSWIFFASIEKLFQSVIYLVFLVSAFQSFTVLYRKRIEKQIRTFSKNRN